MESVKLRKRLSGEERRELILNAACNLFAENGYEKTSTKKLAQAAQCSEALLYKYFESKKAIMDTLLAEWEKAKSDKVTLEIIDHSAFATLKKHYEDFIATPKSEPINPSMRPNLLNALNSTPIYRQKTQEAFKNSADMIRDTILPVIRLGQELGEFRQGEPLILANLFVGYMVGAREIAENFPGRFTPLPFDRLAAAILE